MTAVAVADRRSPGRVAADSLADSVVLLLLLTVLQRLIGFGRGLCFCRWLDPEELGQWDMSFSFLMMAAPIAVLSLPGVFGRYLEHYRQAGQFRTFLRRVAVVTAILAVLSLTVVWLARPWFSSKIFGRADRVELVGYLAVCLLAVIANNFATELFTALRQQRVSSGVQFLHSAVFALLGILFLLGWRLQTASIVLAYAIAGCVSFAVSLVWIAKAWQATSSVLEPVPQRSFWGKLAPFAASVWFTNWLTSLFSIVDRYMIVHFSGMQASQALAEVGQYHSSRLVPLLLVMVAGMLSAIVIPHLSQDWELGQRDTVARRLNLILKVVALTFSAVAVVVLVGSPLAFDVLFHGKFSGGLAVLPWTLAYCIWTSLAFLARNYLWCAEKAWLGSLAYVAGIAVNIVLNFILLPRFGLTGAVWSTAAGNLIALALILCLDRWLGMRIDRGTWLALAVPAIMALGGMGAAAALCAVALAVFRTDWFFNAQERALLAETCAHYQDRARMLLRRGEFAPAIVDCVTGDQE